VSGVTTGKVPWVVKIWGTRGKTISGCGGLLRLSSHGNEKRILPGKDAGERPASHPRPGAKRIEDQQKGETGLTEWFT